MLLHYPFFSYHSCLKCWCLSFPVMDKDNTWHINIHIPLFFLSNSLFCLKSFNKVKARRMIKMWVPSGPEWNDRECGKLWFLYLFKDEKGWRNYYKTNFITLKRNPNWMQWLNLNEPKKDKKIDFNNPSICVVVNSLINPWTLWVPNKCQSTQTLLLLDFYGNKYSAVVGHFPFGLHSVFVLELGWTHKESRNVMMDWDVKCQDKVQGIKPISCLLIIIISSKLITVQSNRFRKSALLHLKFYRKTLVQKL